MITFPSPIIRYVRQSPCLWQAYAEILWFSKNLRGWTKRLFVHSRIESPSVHITLILHKIFASAKHGFDQGSPQIWFSVYFQNIQMPIPVRFTVSGAVPLHKGTALYADSHPHLPENSSLQKEGVPCRGIISITYTAYSLWRGRRITKMLPCPGTDSACNLCNRFPVMASPPAGIPGSPVTG